MLGSKCFQAHLKTTQQGRYAILPFKPTQTHSNPLKPHLLRGFLHPKNLYSPRLRIPEGFDGRLAELVIEGGLVFSDTS